MKVKLDLRFHFHIMKVIPCASQLENSLHSIMRHFLSLRCDTGHLSFYINIVIAISIILLDTFFRVVLFQKLLQRLFESDIKLWTNTIKMLSVVKIIFFSKGKSLCGSRIWEAKSSKEVKRYSSKIKTKVLDFVSTNTLLPIYFYH